MLSNLIVRKATPLDVDFIAETIVEADKSGTPISSMSNILSISEKEYRTILTKILAEDDVEGQEFSLSGFLVADLHGEPIGALGSWIEMATGVPSHILYSTILLHQLDREKIPLVLAHFRITRELNFRKESGCIIFEYGYVKKAYRRRGVFTRLMIESIKKHYPTDSVIPKVQGSVFTANYPSLSANKKLGFQVVETKISENEELKKLFPYNEKVKLEMGQDRIVEVLRL